MHTPTTNTQEAQRTPQTHEAVGDDLFLETIDEVLALGGTVRIELPIGAGAQEAADFWRLALALPRRYGPGVVTIDRHPTNAQAVIVASRREGRRVTLHSLLRRRHGRTAFR